MSIRTKRSLALVALLACTLAASLMATGVAGAGGRRQAGLEPTLNVGWYGGALGQAFQSVVIDGFQKATGVKVTLVPSFDNVRLTSLKADPGALDVAFFTAPVMPDVISANIPSKLPTGKIPNLKWVYKNLKAPNAFAWSFGVWGIAYNADQVKPAPTSWADLLNPKYCGHLTEPDITFNSSFLTLLALSKLGGGSLTNLDPGFSKIEQLRKCSPFFWASDAQMIPQLLSGNIWMSPYANGGTYTTAQQPGAPPIKFVIPKEGGYLVPFNLVIPRGAHSPNAALAFANYLLAPKVQAAWAEQTFYSPANSRTKIPADVASKILTGKTVLTLKQVDWKTLAKTRAQIIQRWQSTIH